MIVLGIETTCDETAVAIVENGSKILSNVIFSQSDLHKEYGGVFPELACRKHLDVIMSVIEKALKQAKITLEEIDLISVAKGPGLVGAIIIGLNVAKTLSYCLDIPFIGVNHIEAHLYSSMMHLPTLPSFPAIGVIISGGHTNIVTIHNIGDYEAIGATVDDAIGESFDKVAKMLHLPYPGGPEIEKLAQLGDITKYPFKPCVVKNHPLNFSFSGLKTAVLRKVHEIKNENLSLENEKKHLAAGFQFAALTDIVYKSIKAAKQVGCSSIFLGGGVSNSSKLRELFAAYAPSTFQIYFPEKDLSLDNAAMIAGLAYHLYTKTKTGDGFDLSPSPRIPFSTAALPLP